MRRRLGVVLAVAIASWGMAYVMCRYGGQTSPGVAAVIATGVAACFGWAAALVAFLPDED